MNSWKVHWPAQVDLSLLTLVGGVGWLSGAEESRLFAHLLWLAVAALPIGILAGRSCWMSWLPPLIWILPLFTSAHSVPQPGWAALVVLGLFGMGHGIGELVGPAGRSGAAGLSGLLLLGLAFLAPLGGILHRPWDPGVGALLLDLSPLSLLLESAGLDWVRSPRIYELVDGASIGPELRVAWAGKLAGPVALMVGCLCALLGNRLRPAKETTEDGC